MDSFLICIGCFGMFFLKIVVFVHAVDIMLFNMVSVLVNGIIVRCVISGNHCG